MRYITRVFALGTGSEVVVFDARVELVRALICLARLPGRFLTLPRTSIQR